MDGWVWANVGRWDVGGLDVGLTTQELHAHCSDSTVREKKRSFPPTRRISFLSRYICDIRDSFLHSGSWLLSGFFAF